MYLLNHLSVTSSFIMYLLFPEGDEDTEMAFLSFIVLEMIGKTYTKKTLMPFKIIFILNIGVVHMVKVGTPRIRLGLKDNLQLTW